MIDTTERGIGNERFSGLTVIIPRALGATLMCTAALRQLRRAYPARMIRCVAKYPDLLTNLPYVDEVIFEDPQLFTKAIQDHEVIDLTGTLLVQSNRRNDPRHIIDLLCEKANVINDHQGPDCQLTNEEEDAAGALVKSLSVHQKPIVVMATRTSTPNKEWKWQNWQTLVDRTCSVVTWLHVGDRLGAPVQQAQYLAITPRQTVGLLGHVHGVICPDTFVMHAAATRPSRMIWVVTLLGSSRPEWVSYPDFINLFINGLECQPCGRPYSGFDLARASDGSVLTWKNGKARKWECEHVGCMDLITVEMVIEKLMGQLAPSRS